MIVDLWDVCGSIAPAPFFHFGKKLCHALFCLKYYLQSFFIIFLKYITLYRDIPSNMAIKIINPIEDDRWDSFIFSQEQSTIYHHSAWKKVLEKTYRHIHPLYFINENSNNELEAAIPTCLVNSIMTGKRLVSLPFSTRCNPLGKNENQLRETILAVNSETKRLNAQYVEFRMSGHQLLFDKIAVGSCSHYLTHILSLDRTKEDIFNSFHRSMIKQKVRKADRFGLKLIAGKNQTDINTFYRLIF